jgi:uncharacterized membrane protein SirB2
MFGGPAPGNEKIIIQAYVCCAADFLKRKRHTKMKNMEFVFPSAVIIMEVANIKKERRISSVSGWINSSN